MADTEEAKTTEEVKETPETMEAEIDTGIAVSLRATVNNKEKIVLFSR